ncbi:hypothetical protein CRUP_031571 [Coryphaenoides rupestris]|nr:hypothetical protein CRUP_031571 [Coryphaenoides rupestris]
MLGGGLDLQCAMLNQRSTHCAMLNQQSTHVGPPWLRSQGAVEGPLDPPCAMLRVPEICSVAMLRGPWTACANLRGPGSGESSSQVAFRMKQSGVSQGSTLGPLVLQSSRMTQSGVPQGSVLAPLVLQSSRCACRDEAGKSGVSYGSTLGPLVLQSSSSLGFHKAPCWGPWFCRAAGVGVGVWMKQSGVPQGSVLEPLVLQSSRCWCGGLDEAVWGSTRLCAGAPGSAEQQLVACFSLSSTSSGLSDVPTVTTLFLDLEP